MEEESISTINYVPSFARGLNILLVHNNTLSLMYLSSLLEQYTFKVTVTDEIPVAVSLICNHEDRFKLVMVKVSMLGIHALSFLNLLHEREIPVIFISSGGFDAIWGALAKGSCYFLEEPILYKDLKYLWQHVYYSKQAQNANKKSDDDNEIMEKEKIAERWSAYNCVAKEIEDRRESTVGYTDQKKRIVWTPELHLKFTEAVALLGDKNARPKAILNLMNVPDLTARQISSHMQKYKSHLKREQMTKDVGLSPTSTPSNFSARTPSPLGRQSYLHLPLPVPASTASFASQKQDQFVMNYAETKESDIVQVRKAVGDPSFAHEISTGLVNNGSQSLATIVGNPLPGASTGQIQNQPETEYDYIIKMLEEDCDTDNCFRNGVIYPDDVEEYSEMLKKVLENSSSSSRV